MVCKYCGFQNNSESRFCGGCGRKLVQKKRPNRFFWGLFAVSLVIVGVIIGMLIPAEKVGCMLPMDAAKITQVLPMDNGAVAVLYTNGTVKVSGNPYFSEIVSEWNHVTELYYARWNALCGEESLLALTENGSVLTTTLDLFGWNNVKKLILPYEGIVGITVDGNVLARGEWDDDSFLISLTNVDDLIYADVQDIWGCLKKDGSVHLFDSYGYQYENSWNNVKELRDSGHAFYVIKKDGTVDSTLGDAYAALNGATQIVDYQDWLFGVSPEGRLLTHNNGNIYTNTGDLMVDTPGSPYYSGEVDIRQFNQVEDIAVFWGIILLNKDGTVDAIGEYPSWNLCEWKHIEEIYGTVDKGWENLTLYGLQQDDSVIVTEYNLIQDAQMTTENYLGWKLRDIYVGEHGVVGLTRDGELVGDGIYENTDFSVFN